MHFGDPEENFREKEICWSMCAHACVVLVTSPEGRSIKSDGPFLHQCLRSNDTELCPTWEEAGCREL